MNPSKHNFPELKLSRSLLKDLREKIKELKDARLKCFGLGDVTFRICQSTNESDAAGIGCYYCGKKLCCVGCSDRVACLGKNEVHFCSRRCAEDWESVQMNKIKFKNYIWKHPFRALSMVGALITISCAYYIAFDSLKLITAIGASGIITMVASALLYLINQSGEH